LVEKEAKRVKETAHCGALRWEAMKDSILGAISLGLFGSGIDNGAKKGAGGAIGRVANGAATKGAIAAGALGAWIDVKNATTGDKQCGQGAFD
jgi:hypothetical protein